jgi:hypothetical protein
MADFRSSNVLGSSSGGKVLKPVSSHINTLESSIV